MSQKSNFMKESVKRFIKWSATSRIMAYPRGLLKKVVFYIFSFKNIDVFALNETPNRLKAVALNTQVKKDLGISLLNVEAYQIFMAVKNTKKVEGDIAEVGVYKGGSAKVICEVKEDKALHLFDTFEGLPELSEMDDPREPYKGEASGWERIQKGEYCASFENVKAYLKDYPNVHFYKGLFPSTAQPVKTCRFSFVHLDVDLYQSTFSCLEFFYPRMNKGGIMISHDYINLRGVRKAIDDFFEGKPETIIELPGRQCLIVKC